MRPAAAHPYSLEIIAPKVAGGSFQWAIRKHGRVAQRSDRHMMTEDKARQAGEAQIEKLIATGGGTW